MTQSSIILCAACPTNRFFTTDYRSPRRNFPNRKLSHYYSSNDTQTAPSHLGSDEVFHISACKGSSSLCGCHLLIPTSLTHVSIASRRHFYSAAETQKCPHKQSGSLACTLVSQQSPLLQLRTAPWWIISAVCASQT